MSISAVLWDDRSILKDRAPIPTLLYTTSWPSGVTVSDEMWQITGASFHLPLCPSGGSSQAHGYTVPQSSDLWGALGGISVYVCWLLAPSLQALAKSFHLSLLSELLAPGSLQI